MQHEQELLEEELPKKPTMVNFRRPRRPASLIEPPVKDRSPAKHCEWTDKVDPEPYPETPDLVIGKLEDHA